MAQEPQHLKQKAPVLIVLVDSALTGLRERRRVDPINEKTHLAKANIVFVSRGYDGPREKNRRLPYIRVRQGHYYGPQYDFILENEGFSWCRGWEGEAADALQVALALGKETATTIR